MEGAVFRVRYRAPDGHHDDLTTLAEDHDECEGGWMRIPVEGWLALQQLNVRGGGRRLTGHVVGGEGLEPPTSSV